MNLLADEIHNIPGYKEDREMYQFALATIAATIDKLAAGVSMEPVATVAGQLHGDHRWLLAHGSNVAKGDELYTAKAIAAAYQAGRKSVHDSCVDLWKDEYLAAARVQAMEEAANPTDDQLVKGVKAMRLFVTNHSVADFKLGYVAAIRALIGAKT